jgi:hypothetical protein
MAGAAAISEGSERHENTAERRKPQAILAHAESTDRNAIESLNG